MPLIVGAGVASSSSTSPARDQPSAQFLRLDLLYYKAGVIASSAAAFVFLFFFFPPSASTSSPASAESGETRFSCFVCLFTFTWSDCYAGRAARRPPPLPPSHMTKAAPVLCVSLKTAAAYAVCLCVCVTCACIRACLFFCLLFTRFRTACIVFPLCLASIVVCCCSLDRFDNTLLISFNSSVAIEVLAIVTFLHLWAFQP